MRIDRRELFLWGAAGLSTGLATCHGDTISGAEPGKAAKTGLRIKDVKVTPIALPDPPLLAASGCHGPYFLRNIIEIATDEGVTGIGETHGGADVTKALETAGRALLGQSAFAVRRFAADVRRTSESAFAGIELACLDACGRATGRRLCELLGGPVRDDVEFAAYLFYRYAPDDPRLLADLRIGTGRARAGRPLDEWGEVRKPQAMVDMAAEWQKKWGFRVFKLKAGVLSPDAELETMRGMNARFAGKCPLRIDPNGRWKTETALRIGRQLKDLNLEYYEDPVVGQEAMAQVRRETQLPMSTNMCVTEFAHIPQALQLQPVDVVLCDHHYWGGMLASQALGPIAEFANWRLSQHSNNHAGITMAAMIHLAAVIPELTLASDTHYPWLVAGADIIAGANLPIREGRMSIPVAPGLGVELDRDKLARAHEVYKQCGMTGRNDARTMQLVEPGWKRELF